MRDRSLIDRPLLFHVGDLNATRFDLYLGLPKVITRMIIGRALPCVDCINLSLLAASKFMFLSEFGLKHFLLSNLRTPLSKSLPSASVLQLNLSASVAFHVPRAFAALQGRTFKHGQKRGRAGGQPVRTPPK